MKRTPYAHIFILIAFLANTFGPIPSAQAQDFSLPAPGVMVRLSPSFDPPILKGIKVYPDNPFKFEFILDRGDSRLSKDALKDESAKLIKYFLASLTTPEKDLWVNLSPYEKDRIVPDSFGLTQMGRDLLAEDYMLKQITASLIYPEDEMGKKFWKRIYQEAEKKFGTTNIPVNTFNKVWIVPQKAVVYENAKAGTAYVVASQLKVMLEQDYLSMQKHAGVGGDTNALGSRIVREIVIPELIKEVNDGKNFTQLRQIYNSLILAAWYKKKIKDSILAQVYEDKNKVAGVNIDDPKEKQRIYERYLQAFRKGVYNYIKEEQDPVTQQAVPRKYFSGGMDLALGATDLQAAEKLQITSDPAMVGDLTSNAEVVTADFEPAVKQEAPPARVKRTQRGKDNLKLVGAELTPEQQKRFKEESDEFLHDLNNKLASMWLDSKSLEDRFKNAGIENIPKLKSRSYDVGLGSMPEEYLRLRSRGTLSHQIDVDKYNEFKEGIFQALITFEKVVTAVGKKGKVRKFLESDKVSYGLYTGLQGVIKETFDFLSKNGVLEEFDLQEMIYSLAARINDPRIKFNPVFSSQSFQVFSDKQALNRVFENLLKNGKEAILGRFEDDPSLGEMSINGSVDQSGGVAIEITTNGGAMSEDSIARILGGERGVTTKSAKVYGGTDQITGEGIGLPSCLKIIEDLQGKMEIKGDEALGTTTFMVILPARVSLNAFTHEQDQAMAVAPDYTRLQEEALRGDLHSLLGLLNLRTPESSEILERVAIRFNNDHTYSGYDIAVDGLFERKALDIVGRLLRNDGIELSRRYELARRFLHMNGESGKDFLIAMVWQKDVNIKMRTYLAQILDEPQQIELYKEMIKEGIVIAARYLFALSSRHYELIESLQKMFDDPNTNPFVRLEIADCYLGTTYRQERAMGLKYLMEVFNDDKASSKLRLKAASFLADHTLSFEDSSIVGNKLLEMLEREAVSIPGTQEALLKDLKNLIDNNAKQLVPVLKGLKGVLKSMKLSSFTDQLNDIFKLGLNSKEAIAALTEYVHDRDLNENMRSGVRQILLSKENIFEFIGADELIGMAEAEYKFHQNDDTDVKLVFRIFNMVQNGQLKARHDIFRRYKELQGEGIYPLKIFFGKYSNYSAEELSKEAQRVGDQEKPGMDIDKDLDVALNYSNLILEAKLAGSAYEVSFQDFTSIIEKIRQDKVFEESQTQVPWHDQIEIRGLAYEAYQLRKQILAIQKQAASLGRPVVVVENLSYGAVALAPVIEERNGIKKKYIVGTDIPVISSKIGSTESHYNEFVLRQDLFTDTQARDLMERQPVIVVVDGSTSVSDPQRTSPHIPDGFKGYRNYFMAYNMALTGHVNAQDFYEDGNFARDLEKNNDFQSLVAKLKAFISSGSKAPYQFKFWYPGQKGLYLRTNKQRDIVAPKINADEINSPTVIFMQSVMEREAIPENIKNDYIKDPHSPGYFDDTGHYKRFYMNYKPGFGIVYSKQYANMSKIAFLSLLDFLKEPLAQRSDQAMAVNLSRRSVLKTMAGAVLLSQSQVAPVLAQSAFTQDENVSIVKGLVSRGFTIEEAQIIIEEQRRVIGFYSPGLSKEKIQHIHDITVPIHSSNPKFFGEGKWDRITFRTGRDLGSNELMRSWVVHETAHLFFPPSMGLTDDPHSAVYAMGFLRLIERGHEDEVLVNKFNFLEKVDNVIRYDIYVGYELAQEAYAMEKQSPGAGWAYLGRMAQSGPELFKKELIWMGTSPLGILLWGTMAVTGFAYFKERNKNKDKAATRDSAQLSRRGVLESLLGLAVASAVSGCAVVPDMGYKDHGIQKGRINYLTPNNKGKPLLLVIHGANADPFAMVQGILGRLGRQYNILLYAYDDSKALDEIASDLVSEVRKIDPNNDKPVNMRVIVHSYGAVVFRKAVLSADSTLFSGASLIQLAPTAAGSALAQDLKNDIIRMVVSVFSNIAIVQNPYGDIQKELYGPQGNKLFNDRIKNVRTLIVEGDQNSVAYFEDAGVRQRYQNGIGGNVQVVPLSSGVTHGSLPNSAIGLDYLQRILGRASDRAMTGPQSLADRPEYKFKISGSPREMPNTDQIKGLAEEYEHLLAKIIEAMGNIVQKRQQGIRIEQAEYDSYDETIEILKKYQRQQNLSTDLVVQEFMRAINAHFILEDKYSSNKDWDLLNRVSFSGSLKRIEIGDVFTMQEELRNILVYFQYLQSAEKVFVIQTIDDGKVEKAIDPRQSLKGWSYGKTEDQAMAANGGIDLTPANMSLETQNAGDAIKFKMDPAMLQQLRNAPGFVPVIIDIRPLNDLKRFLGITAGV